MASVASPDDPRVKDEPPDAPHIASDLPVRSMAETIADLQPTLAAAAQFLASPRGPAANLHPLEFREMTAALAEVQTTATTAAGPGERAELQEQGPMITELTGCDSWNSRP
jgi:hypothetical protein